MPTLLAATPCVGAWVEHVILGSTCVDESSLHKKGKVTARYASGKQKVGVILFQIALFNCNQASACRRS